MTRISFRINSIDLKQSALHEINPNNLVKIELAQQPNCKSDEYLLKNISFLPNINHEFIIEDTQNKVEKLTLTLFSVLKKTTLASIFNFDNNSVHKNKRKYTNIDKYIERSKVNNDEGCVECEYVENEKSTIGYRNIELKELKKGVNNKFRIELITRGTVKVIGYIDLEIYIWDSPLVFNHNVQQFNNEPILFVDPGCQTSNVLV